MQRGHSIRTSTNPPATGGQTKRTLDMLVALPLLAICTPAMVVIGVWVRLTSKGPAIFRQERVGLHGEAFNLLKFRTMVKGAQQMGSGLAVTDGDSRITSAGAILRRLSLDELPQLINVVRGDMSIIGPRPTVASQVEHYTDHQRKRLLARPGVTGWAQVNGRNHIPWSRRIELDIEYVEGWSLRRDLWILVRTAGVVLGRRGTYRGEEGGFDLPLRTDNSTRKPVV